MRKKISFLTFLLLLLGITEVNAQLRLPYFFADNMVLQQSTDAAIWGWTDPNSKVQISTSWNKKKITAVSDADGKWKTKMATPAAGGPYEITISGAGKITLKNVLIGEVWLCAGQSNMEMPMKGFRDQPILHSNDDIFNSGNSSIRIYTVPRSVQRIAQDTTKSAVWKIAEPESISNFSATAYYFGRLLNDKLKVPVGLINISYGGSPVEAFMDEQTLKLFPEIKIPSKTDTAKLNNKIATVLYNGMLGPFMGFTVKGCIWYQGETNYERPAQYEKLLPVFVQQLREQSGVAALPFYYAQVAPFSYAANYGSSPQSGINSAYLRDAQRKALAQIPNSGMVVLMDIGEENSIHPMNKEAGGKRFAYMALGKTYGLRGFAAESPAYESMTIKDSAATLKFTNTPNGLTSFGKGLNQFEIAGADKVFYPAIATISATRVVVTSPQVSKPVAVRYAFKDFIVGDLFSTEGLPVSSFRTDDW